MGHQNYVLLCTKTTLSNHPAVFPRLYCDVHLLRSPWLSLPISDWKNHEGFKEVESFVRNILVVNDTAERGIKLISGYANCLTKNASESQEILQLVEYHRSKISDDKKSTIKRSYNRDFLM